MQTRRRVPVLFSMSMVDVLCCALGCVILLWLVNSREAKKQNEKAGQTQQELDKTDDKLKDVFAQLDQTKDKLDDTTRKLDGANADLSKATIRASKLQEELEALLQQKKDLLAQLKLQKDDNQDLAKEKATIAEQLAKLEQLLKDKNLKLADANKNFLAADDLAKLLQEKLGISDKKVKDLAAQLGTSDKLIKEKIGELKVSDLEMAKLLTEAKNANKLIADLQKLVQTYKDQATTNAGKLDQSKDKVTALNKELEKKNLKLEVLLKDLEEVAKLKKDLEDVAALKKALEAQLKTNNLNLSKADLDITQLKKEKLELLLKAAALKDEMANRFAGIELTGKKVIFLVDMSGSMGMLDTKTADDKKWPMVCEIIGKIIRSLPDPTHYQVITFSDKVSYPLGYKRQWIHFDQKHSADFVVAKLQKIKPTGATSMYPAFEEAFFYKVGGLDTIYLISDGLPDPPEEDLPAHIKQLTPSQQSAHFCTEVRSKLKNAWNAPVNGKTPVRINAVGFYFDSPEVGAFLWALTRDNNGSFVGMSKP